MFEVGEIWKEYNGLDPEEAKSQILAKYPNAQIEVIPENSGDSQSLPNISAQSRPTVEQSSAQHGAIPRHTRHRPALVERPHTRAHDAIAGPVPSVQEQLQQQEERKKAEKERKQAQRQARIDLLSKPKPSKQRTPKTSKPKSKFKSKSVLFPKRKK